MIEQANSIDVELEILMKITKEDNYLYTNNIINKMNDCCEVLKIINMNMFSFNIQNKEIEKKGIITHVREIKTIINNLNYDNRETFYHAIKQMIGQLELFLISIIINRTIKEEVKKRHPYLDDIFQICEKKNKIID